MSLRFVKGQRPLNPDYNAVVFTAISNPVPGEQALHANDQVIEIELDQFHQSLWTSLDSLVCDDLPIVFDEADIEVLGVQFYSAVMLVRFG